MVSSTIGVAAADVAAVGSESFSPLSVRFPADVLLSSTAAAAGAHRTPSLSRSAFHSAADAHKTPSLSRSAFVVTSSLKLLSSLLLLNSFAAVAFVLLQ